MRPQPSENTKRLPPLECPSAYVTLVQKITWSKNKSPLLFSPKTDNRFEAVSRTVRRREAPDRPCVQLNNNIRSPPLYKLSAMTWHPKKRTNLSLRSNKPTSELTNHCKQYSILSEVWAPSRYHVIRGKRESRTVWQRPGHLASFKPDTYDSGIVSFEFSSRKTVPASAIARLAFWYWWVPDRPTKGQ